MLRTRLAQDRGPTAVPVNVAAVEVAHEGVDAVLVTLDDHDLVPAREELPGRGHCDGARTDQHRPHAASARRAIQVGG